MSPHSPTPWRVDGATTIVDAAGDPVTVVIGEHTSVGDDIDNAARIVRAVSAHEELVRMLWAAVFAFKSYKYGNAATELAASMAERAEALLAKVTNG